MGETAVLAEFLHKIRINFAPELVILFGSRARGEELKNSDFGLIIVSEKFRGKHFLERMSAIYEFWERDEDLNPLTYTPEEFEEKSKEIGIVSQALKEGIKLYQKHNH
jgi:hypothetical protein